MLSFKARELPVKDLQKAKVYNMSNVVTYTFFFSFFLKFNIVVHENEKEHPGYSELPCP